MFESFLLFVGSVVPATMSWNRLEPTYINLSALLVTPSKTIHHYTSRY